MWVRGLKPFESTSCFKIIKSHPMWVRGLKLNILLGSLRYVEVAPYVGAWIET